jgi:fatty acid-binding protein DegV
LVFLNVSGGVRAARLAERGLKAADVQVADDHPAEQDLRAALRAAADLVLDGDQPLERLVSLTADRVREWA